MTYATYMTLMTCGLITTTVSVVEQSLFSFVLGMMLVAGSIIPMIRHGERNK